MADEMADKDAPFLKRWSKLKQAEAEAAPDIDEANAVTPMDGADDVDAVPPPDLPDIDTLDAQSDFTGFLQAGVPEQLKRAALRKLFSVATQKKVSSCLRFTQSLLIPFRYIGKMAQ